jgi:hypothetical protein
MTSAKVDINGWPIWYEKYGSGQNVILLIPGAIGMKLIFLLLIT